MNFNKLKEVFNSKGIKEFEVYKVKEESNDIATRNGEVDKNTVEFANEMYIRGVYNNHITTIYVEHDTDDEIETVANKIIANTSVIESEDPYIIYEGSKEYPKLEEVPNDYDEYSQSDLIELAKKIEKYCKDKCEYVFQTNAQIGVSKKEISIVNSNGLNVSRKSSEAVVVVSSTIKKDGDVKSGFAVDYVKNFKDVDFEKLYVEAVKRPVSSIGAASIPSKAYPVVFENKTAASLLGCFSSMFSGDSVIRKMSILGSKMDQKVFGENINIVDDPFCEDSVTKYSFDDEGVAAKKKTVVENGVLKTFLHNLKTAKMMGVEPTGNGFKFGSGAPSNLCYMPNAGSFDELIKDIKDGVLITGLMGQHAGVNLASGGFNLQSSGFKIIDGKIGEPVTLIIVSGNIVDLLNNVVGISNDFVCRNHVGTGSLYVKALNISGK